jgi:hypothetical protein
VRQAMIFIGQAVNFFGETQMSDLKVRPITAATKARVEEVLERAATDINFRNLLLRDPSRALCETSLSEAEIEMLASMRRVALEEWGVDVRRFRSFLRDNGTKVTVAPI